MKTRGKRYDVIIKGNGPAALAITLEALKSGASVLLIKSEETLSKRVLLDEKAKEYLQDLSTNFHFTSEVQETKEQKQDRTFFNLLETDKNFLTKDIESYLEHRIDEHNEITSVINKGEIKTIPVNVNEQLDLENGK